MVALKRYPQFALNRWCSGVVSCVQEISLSCESSLLLIEDLWNFHGKLQVLSEHDSMSHFCGCCLVPVLYIARGVCQYINHGSSSPFGAQGGLQQRVHTFGLQSHPCPPAFVSIICHAIYSYKKERTISEIICACHDKWRRFYRGWTVLGRPIC